MLRVMSLIGWTVGFVASAIALWTYFSPTALQILPNYVLDICDARGGDNERFVRDAFYGLSTGARSTRVAYFSSIRLTNGRKDNVPASPSCPDTSGGFAPFNPGDAVTQNYSGVAWLGRDPIAIRADGNSILQYRVAVYMPVDEDGSRIFNELPLHWKGAMIVQADLTPLLPAERSAGKGDPLVRIFLHRIVNPDAAMIERIECTERKLRFLREGADLKVALACLLPLKLLE